MYIVIADIAVPLKFMAIFWFSFLIGEQRNVCRIRICGEMNTPTAEHVRVHSTWQLHVIFGYISLMWSNVLSIHKLLQVLR